jgi:transcriptional regulator GlxA family with amidase domain
VTFSERVKILSHYFQSIITKYSGSTEPIRIVSSILQHCEKQKDFTTSVEEFAGQYKISTRTLQRYFEMTTSISSKKALQILRIRMATEHLATSPDTFHYSNYGYYDHSHFYKSLKMFLQKKTIKTLQPHLKLLKALHV